MGKFTADIIRDVYKAAVKQRWVPQPKSKSGHMYLQCPRRGCHYREAFSTTAKGKRPEVESKLRDMRSHGFIWKGRGGKHTAEPLRRRPGE